MLSHSARAFGLRAPAIWQGQWVMTWYAAVHSEPYGLYEDQYQPLQTACLCLGIFLPEGGQLHSAATDATLTAQIMLRLADRHHQEQARLTPAPVSRV